MRKNFLKFGIILFLLAACCLRAGESFAQIAPATSDQDPRRELRAVIEAAVRELETVRVVNVSILQRLDRLRDDAIIYRQDYTEADDIQWLDEQMARLARHVVSSDLHLYPYFVPMLAELVYSDIYGGALVLADSTIVGRMLESGATELAQAGDEVAAVTDLFAFLAYGIDPFAPQAPYDDRLMPGGEDSARLVVLKAMTAAAGRLKPEDERRAVFEAFETRFVSGDFIMETLASPSRHISLKAWCLYYLSHRRDLAQHRQYDELVTDSRLRWLVSAAPSYPATLLATAAWLLQTRIAQDPQHPAAESALIQIAYELRDSAIDSIASQQTHEAFAVEKSRALQWLAVEAQRAMATQPEPPVNDTDEQHPTRHFGLDKRPIHFADPAFPPDYNLATVQALKTAMASMRRSLRASGAARFEEMTALGLGQLVALAVNTVAVLTPDALTLSRDPRALESIKPSLAAGERIMRTCMEQALTHYAFYWPHFVTGFNAYNPPPLINDPATLSATDLLRGFVAVSDFDSAAHLIARQLLQQMSDERSAVLPEAVVAPTVSMESTFLGAVTVARANLMRRDVVGLAFANQVVTIEFTGRVGKGARAAVEAELPAFRDAISTLSSGRLTPASIRLLEVPKR